MKKRVCLLLSERMLAEVIRDYLVKNGYDVSHCAYGNLKMTIYLAQQPDVIILEPEDLEKLQTFFAQLDPEDRAYIYHAPIVLFPSPTDELCVTCAADKFELSQCESQNIAEAIMFYANKGTL